MKNLQNNFTTPEQSNRLLALRVPANSADCYYIDSMTYFQDKSPHIIPPYYKYSDGIPNGYESRFCPCWSVGRLMEICKICEPKKYYEQLCEELQYSKNYCVVIISHIIANLPIIDFSKLEE